MVTNAGYIKTEKTKKQARNTGEQKQPPRGKTWQRTDKRQQFGESE